MGLCIGSNIYIIYFRSSGPHGQRFFRIYGGMWLSGKGYGQDQYVWSSIPIRSFGPTLPLPS